MYYLFSAKSENVWDQICQITFELHSWKSDAIPSQDPLNIPDEEYDEFFHLVRFATIDII